MEAFSLQVAADGGNMIALRHDGLAWALVRGAALTAGCFAFFGALEWWQGMGMARYRTRHFAVDLCYRLLYVVYVTALWAPLVAAAKRAYPVLDLNLLDHAPLWLALPVSWVLFDFLGYWVHRAQHTRLWWPLHRVHHSQEH